MATIVRIKDSTEEDIYILLGLSYKYAEGWARRPSIAYVCDEDGNIHEFKAAEIDVVLVDNKPPTAIFEEADHALGIRGRTARTPYR